MRAALAVLLVLAMATPSGAGLFRWTAPDGAIHYTSDPESIPEKYRAAAVDVGAPAPNPTPPAPPVPARPVASRCCRAEASKFYPQNWEEAFRGLRCRSSRHAPGVRSDHAKSPALLLLQTLTSEASDGSTNKFGGANACP